MAVYGIILLGGAAVLFIYYLYRQRKDPGMEIFPRNKG